jgi:Xaa-Pro aminopeptidase
VAAAGCDAALVWSKGGGFMDMNADVLYLTNHYSQYAFVGEEAGVGSGRAHAAVLLPVDGPTSLVTDVSFWHRDLVVADSVVPTMFVPQTVARLVREAGLASSRLALVGSSYLTTATYLRLREALPEADFVWMDRLIEDQRIHKSASELAVIRLATALGNRAVDALMDAVVEGNTEAMAAAEATRTVVADGGLLYDAACASGPWSEHFTYARLPSADAGRPLQRGDLFHVDCYGAYGGYFFDLARSRVVGDAPSPRQQELLDAVIEGVETVIAAVRPGVTGGDLHRVGRRWMERSAFVRALASEPAMDGPLSFGHGIGLGWERPWLVEHDCTVLEPDMYLAVEILLGHPSIGGAMFEHSGLVTGSGFEVLTTARERW